MNTIRTSDDQSVLYIVTTHTYIIIRDITKVNVSLPDSKQRNAIFHSDGYFLLQCAKFLLMTITLKTWLMHFKRQWLRRSTEYITVLPTINPDLDTAY